MSNFIVAHGLGGGLLVTQGWGADLSGLGGGEIVRTAGGTMRIFIRKIGGEFILLFWDGSNINQYVLPATAEQKAGTKWMIVKVSRQGSDLLVSLDKNDPISLPLALKKTYSGDVTFMNRSKGGLFDPRVIPRAISKEGLDYYHDDIYENAGKTLLPNR